jgi:hypothetical protein
MAAAGYGVSYVGFLGMYAQAMAPATVIGVAGSVIGDGGNVADLVVPAISSLAGVSLIGLTQSISPSPDASANRMKNSLMLAVGAAAGPYLWTRDTTTAGIFGAAAAAYYYWISKPISSTPTVQISV